MGLLRWAIVCQPEVRDYDTLQYKTEEVQIHVEITKWELQINSFLDMYTLLPLEWIN